MKYNEIFSEPFRGLFGHAACQNEKALVQVVHVTFLMFNAKELGNLQGSHSMLTFFEPLQPFTLCVVLCHSAPGNWRFM